MSLVCDLDEKHFFGLLNGLKKQVFEKDESITTDYLKEQVFGGSDMSADEVKGFLSTMTRLLQQAAYEHQTASRLLDQLKETDLSEPLAAVFGKFWNKERGAIHDLLVAESQWTSGLESVAWRIDVKTNSRHNAELNDATAIMELGVKEDGKSAALAFEMDRATVTSVLGQLEQIRALIEAQS